MPGYTKMKVTPSLQGILSQVWWQETQEGFLEEEGPGGEEKGKEGRLGEVFRAEGGACAKSFVISETD